MAIILRNTKGAPLTHVEMDNNLNELDTRINDLETGSTNPLVFANGADITAVESPANTITISNTSTLDTVTGRGATTANNITVGQATVNSAINFVSPNSSNTMTASINNSDVLTISGDSGVLFSITETPDSTLKVFDSVNNLVLEVAQNGNIILNETVGYTLIGSGSAVGTNKLQVTGAANVTGNFTVGGVITGDGGGITFSTLSAIPTTVSGYGITDFDSSVDTHLNTSTATTGQVLTWNGSDYTWNTVSAGSSGIALTDLSVTVATAGSANLVYDNVNGIFTYTPPDLSSYLTTETDPVVGAITGIVKSDGAGNISAAVAGTDYIATETDPVVGAITGIVKADGAGNISAAVAGTDYLASYTETDPVVGAVTGIVKSDGAGNISAAVAGTDYLTSVAFGDLTSTPTTVSGYGITDFNSSVNTHLNIGTATAGEFLSWNGLDYNWISINSTVDTHINTGSASAGEILSWNGLDYEWVADSGIALTDLSVTVAAAGSANLAYDNTTGIFTYTPPDLSSYLTSYTETDPVVGAITGLVKSDGAGNISSAVAGTDYIATETDPVVGAITGIVKADGAGNISAAIAGTDYLASYTETDPVVGAIAGIVKADGAGNISAAIAGTDYLASYTETDPVVGAITGIVKSDGAGNISAAIAGTDYVATETDPVVGAITGLVKADGAGNISAAVAGTDYVATETDPVVGAITGIVKADGAGNISAAVAGTDYLTSVAFGDLTSTPTTISGYGITDFDSSVDTHLNTGTATTNQILTWDGADYDWVSEVIVDSVNYRFILGANGTTDFTFSDAANIWFPTTENDPVLYLRRGETYIFQNDSSETFEIRVSNGGAAYSTGVTNNAASTGDIIFKVPMSAPATLYYQSTVNSGMGNTINIV